MSGSIVSLNMDELESAAELVYRVVSPTPQYAWPNSAAAPDVQFGSNTRITRRPALSRFGAASCIWTG